MIARIVRRTCALALGLGLAAGCSGGGTSSPAPPPVISSFTAQPVSIPSGRSSTLSWTVTNATSLSIDQGVGDVTGRTTATVSPTIDTTYTLTATGAGGSATRSTPVTVHAPLLHLQYDDPSAGVGKLRLVRNSSSTATHLVLDLQVGANALTGFGVALTLPLDPAKVAFNPGTGLILNASVLDAGNSPATAAARLPASGPLQNMLVVGVARKKLSATDGDLAFAAGATVFSLGIDMNGAPPEGVIFTGTSLGAKFRAAMLNKAGAEVVSNADVAIGNLSVSL